MTYIYNKEDGHIKKCETTDCPNEVFIGFSRQYCRECLQEKKEKTVFKIIPEFIQRRMM